MIKVHGIHKSFNGLNVLKGIDLQISKGEIISIIGASGAGKSTLLHIMGTLDKPDSGIIEIEGTSIQEMNDKKVSEFRNSRIGFVFQFHHLLPEFTALENICIPAYIKGISKKQAENKAKELLMYLNLTDRMGHKPSQLSGGEQQRVAVARALINDPAIILADEPSGNLDSASSTELHNLFLELRLKLNQTFVIVTHNKELASLSDRIMTIRDGVIINS